MMQYKTKQKLTAIAFVLVLALGIAAVAAGPRWLPSSTVLLEKFQGYLATYGYSVVFIAALIESIPPVNFYFPGSAIVVLAVAASKQGQLNIAVVLVIAAVAFLISYVVNYGVGRLGLHSILVRCGLGQTIEKWKQRVSTHGLIWMWLACIHPNIAALAAVSCGLLQISFWQFLWQTSVATIAWVSFWGGLTYFAEAGVVKLLDLRWLLIAASVWLFFRLVTNWRRGDASTRNKDGSDVPSGE